MEAVPLVSVVVVCLNQVDLSRQCLSSLFQQDYPNFEVIVVDNGSQDNIAVMVREEFPQARLFVLTKNLGFSGGYNRGMLAAKGEYIAIINNDALAELNWLSAMVASAKPDRLIGAVAPLILDGNNPNHIDSYGVGLALDGMSRQRMRGFRVPEKLARQDVLLVSGCACLFRTDALRVTGYFDEDFFAYCEDTDLGLRLAWAGYRVVSAPDAVVIHHYSQTTGKYSPQKVFWVERNHFWVAIKNFPFAVLLLVPIYTIYRYFLQLYLVVFKIGDLSGFIGIQNGKKALLLSILRSHISFWAGLPKMISKRHAIRRNATRTSKNMIRLIKNHRISLFEILAAGVPNNEK